MQKPIDTKESGSDYCDDLGLSWSWSSVQGWRPRQEDAHIALSPASDSGGWNGAGFFAVLDGHRGSEVAHLAKRWLPNELVAHPHSEHCTPFALKKAFHKVDERIGTPDGRKELRSLGRKLGKEGTVGCAAVACVVEKEAIVVANLGNCRAVLCREGGEAAPLTKDHTAELPREHSRIVAAGGWVEPTKAPWGAMQHRVNGILNVSRSLGDMQFKKDPHLKSSEQIISGVPDIKTAKREAGDEFLILACDGVWEARSEQFVVDFIRNGLRKNGGGSDGATKVLEALLDSCLSPHPAKTKGLGCDNMTAILVNFTKASTKDTLKRKMSLDDHKERLRNDRFLSLYKSALLESAKEDVTKPTDGVSGRGEEEDVTKPTDGVNGRGEEDVVPETQKKTKRRKVRIMKDGENCKPKNLENVEGQKECAPPFVEGVWRYGQDCCKGTEEEKQRSCNSSLLSDSSSAPSSVESIERGTTSVLQPTLRDPDSCRFPLQSLMISHLTGTVSKTR